MKISIITVTYNSGLTLRDTILSVLSQSFFNLEYIIVDGGSVDNTVDIINEYQKYSEGKLKWISESDQGIYDAMNKGIRMATGDIVGILNSDDFFTSKDILQKIALEFEEDLDLDAVYGDVHYVKPYDLNNCVRYYSSRIFKRSRMRMGLMPAHPSFYVRRSCYENYGRYRTTYKICADFELLLRFIYVKQIKIKYLSLDMVTMRLGGVSTSGFRSYICIMKEHLRAFKENHIYTNALFLSTRYFFKLIELIKK